MQTEATKEEGAQFQWKLGDGLCVIMRASSDMFVSQEGVDDRNERKRREGGAEAARAAAPRRVATTPKRNPRDGGARSPSASTPRRSVSAYLLYEHAFTFMNSCRVPQPRDPVDRKGGSPPARVCVTVAPF